MNLLRALFGKSIDSTEARRLVAQGALLLDVRTPDEFAEAHIPGAVNIPVQVLPERMGELPDRGRAIVLYCRSGMRSARATSMLRRAGYTAAHDLGGMSNW